MPDLDSRTRTVVVRATVQSPCAAQSLGALQSCARPDLRKSVTESQILRYLRVQTIVRYRRVGLNFRSLMAYLVFSCCCLA
jgi:hypothetical protein